ncbi:MAG TPA: shikimate dehydrogenase [Longimicrobiaceae bacterium]|nr:shikimate dehydrogenase [Longimicrobiaceae bacterium]
MSGAPTAATRLLALLGDPVSHSLSPLIQNAALRALGLDAVYVALRCAGGDVAGLLRGIARAGGAGNVTVPHKAAALAAVDVASEDARATGACNAFWLEDGAVHGDNTDVEGVRRAVDTVGRGIVPAHVLLVGAGGAASAALRALQGMGTDHVILLNRTPERAEALAERFAGDGTFLVTPQPADVDLRDYHFHLIVNASSLGLRPDDPLPPTAGARFGGALDLVYARDDTPFVREMRGRGIPALDGKEVLLHQGAAAFRRWFGVEPPVEAMRRALFPSSP